MLPSDLKPIPVPISARVGLIGRLSRREKVAALAATIPVASPTEIEALAPELLELMARRPAGEAPRVAARLFSLLPEQARSAAACMAAAELASAILSHDPADPLVRRSIPFIAAVHPDAQLLCRLPALLLDADPHVSTNAEAAAVSLAAQPGLPPDTAAALESMFLESVSAFEQHRRRGVLGAFLQRFGTPTGLALAASHGAEWINDPGHPAQLAIRSLLRRGQTPEIARAALVWLRLPSQTSACRERLLAAGTLAEHEAVLSLGHLMTHPVRRRALAGQLSPRHRDAEVVWSLDAGVMSSLPEAARRFLPAWAGLLPLPENRRAEATGLLFGDPSPVVRLASLRAAAAHRRASVMDDAFDEHPSIARAAALRLALPVRGTRPGTHEGHPAAALRRLSRSPHPIVRSICHRAGEGEHAPEGRMRWRLALRKDRSGAMAELRHKVLVGTTPERTAWIQTARRIGAAPALERELCEIVTDALGPTGVGAPADSVLVATAVAALGEGVKPFGADVLNTALASIDPRVQANAVEALARRGRTSPASAGAALADRLAEVKDRFGHRARAGSVLAMLQLASEPDAVRKGLADLSQMVGDHRAMHRLAGVWMAERAVGMNLLGAEAVGPRIESLLTDDDEAVRARAKRCSIRIRSLTDALMRAPAAAAGEPL